MPVSFSWSVSLSSAFSTSSETSSADEQLRDIKLNATGDALELVNGDLVFLTGVDAFVSDLKAHLETWLGEHFLDTTLGLDWAGKVLGQKLDSEKIRAELERVVLLVPGAEELESFTLTKGAARAITVAFRVRYSGDAMVEVVLGVSNEDEEV